MKFVKLPFIEKPSRISLVTYWAITVACAWELIYGAYWDLSRNSHVTDMFNRLGYPYYLLTLLGFWKLAATVAILVPRFRLLKEWAYAGCVFLFTGAAFSHFSVGEREITNGIWCIIGALLFITSWALRPPSRRIVIPAGTRY
jgi:uncharacterized membrane protein YphA (DoxX/SURF4 family)